MVCFAGEYVGLFQAFGLGAEQSNDPEATVGNFVVRVLAHEHDAFADLGIQCVGQLAADDDAVVIGPSRKRPSTSA